MEQNGADNSGIWGFLEKDIKKCAKNCASTKCVYCNQNSASIQCKYKSCKKKFHLVCGVQNGCLFQFTDAFSSYCNQHHGIKDEQVDQHDKCMICWDPMGTYNPITSIPSCCNQGWFHANCMRKSTIQAGYLFSCPMCGVKNDEYSDMIRKRGIYLPDRDATWELTQNAYNSLLFQYASCDAKTCFSPSGRNFIIKRRRSKWFLLRCIYCGSKGVHFACSPHDMKEYKCHECTVARSQMTSTQSQPTESQMSQRADGTTTKATTFVDLKLDENSNNFVAPTAKRSLSEPTEETPPKVEKLLMDFKPQPVDNFRGETSKDCIQSTEISSSTENKPLMEGNLDALVSVTEYSDNTFKERTILLARDQPPAGTQFVEDQKKLSMDRLNLLLLGKWD